MLAYRKRWAVAGKISDLITTGTAPETVEHGADIDVVERLEFEPVDRNHRVRNLHLLVQVDAEQAADVAVAGEHERMAVLQHAREP